MFSPDGFYGAGIPVSTIEWLKAKVIEHPLHQHMKSKVTLGSPGEWRWSLGTRVGQNEIFAYTMSSGIEQDIQAD